MGWIQIQLGKFTKASLSEQKCPDPRQVCGRDPQTVRSGVTEFGGGSSSGGFGPHFGTHCVGTGFSVFLEVARMPRGRSQEVCPLCVGLPSIYCSTESSHHPWERDYLYFSNKIRQAEYLAETQVKSLGSNPGSLPNTGSFHSC